MHGHPVDRGDVADLGRGVGHRVPAVLAEVEGDDRLGDHAVLGRDGTDHVPHDAGEAVQPGDLAPDRREIARGQPAGPDVDHNRGDVVLVLERRELLERPRRLGAGRQPRRRLVVLDVGEAAGEAGGDAEHDDPEGEHDPLGDGAGELAGDLAVHGGLQCVPGENETFEVSLDHTPRRPPESTRFRAITGGPFYPYPRHRVRRTGSGDAAGAHAVPGARSTSD